MLTELPAKLDQLQPLRAELWEHDPELSFDASWARPVPSPDCGESGTRTVQINQAVVLEPGQTIVTDGDAGLRVELTRGR